MTEAPVLPPEKTPDWVSARTGLGFRGLRVVLRLVRLKAVVLFQPL